jgi:hypothetical protein
MVRPIFETRLNKTLSINENNFDKSLLIFPNPAQKRIFISNKTIDFKGVELFTIDGRQLSIFDSNINEISLEDYPTGIILIREISNGKLHKIVKI